MVSTSRSCTIPVPGRGDVPLDLTVRLVARQVDDGSDASVVIPALPEQSVAWPGAIGRAQVRLDERSEAGGVYALNREDGKLRWQSKIYGSIYPAVALDSRGTLYTGSHVGHVFAIDTANGQWLADFDAGAPVWSAPSIRADGTLVTADVDSRVLVLGAG